MSIAQKIIASHYVATEQQIETLAHDRYSAFSLALSSDLTYLRVLLVEIQSKLGKRTRRMPTKEAQTSLLDAAHDRFYPAVLRGITTPEIANEPGLDPALSSSRARERNARSNFARTAKATLLHAIDGGLDLRSLDAATTTKTGLRAAVAPPEPEDPVERRVGRSTGVLLRAYARWAKRVPVDAVLSAETLMDKLQAFVDSIGDVEPDQPGETTIVSARAPRDAGHQRTRATPQLHRGA